MLSKCANPACFTSFRYLRHGRLFRIERQTSSPEGWRQTGARIEHFWLCESEKVLTVVCVNGVASTQPIRPVPVARSPRDLDQPALGMAFQAGASS
jgi:hypothetical protein